MDARYQPHFRGTETQRIISMIIYFFIGKKSIMFLMLFFRKEY